MILNILYVIQVKQGLSSLKPRKVCVYEYGTGALHKVFVGVEWIGFWVKHIRELLAGLMERPHVFIQFSKAEVASCKCAWA